MILPTRTVVDGVSDPGQAAEAAALGVDGMVLRVGEPGPVGIDARTAQAIAAAVPPLVDLWCLPASGVEAPGLADAVVTAARTRPPLQARRHIVRVAHDQLDATAIPETADAVWVQPRATRSGAATAFDFRRLERASRSLRLVLEIPDGAAGVETAMRLGRPFALLFADAVWRHPGIIDLDRLEAAMAVTARLNKAAYP
ncbi:MAG: hypothetical protein Q9Q40_01875 [Acidobacteriota bacterium]|nr:hypothetical protein [Acidobacteriota bacterium]MDQ7088055.1 hypothetical protein [Acidobacteriota bacterium]